MKCIVGLGNPGRKYKDTRHNVGFMVIDALLNHFNVNLDKSKFNGMYTIVNVMGEKVLLLKPQTYMNLSGESVHPLMDYYQIDHLDCLVINDDLDLPNGKIRLRQKGGHGGHNGIRSIIQHLGTKEFKRLRVGIGRPVGQVPVVDYVLGKFTGDEELAMDKSVNKAKDACIQWLNTDFTLVMNEYNQ